jgi:phosphohistidine phosphatase SixA
VPVGRVLSSQWCRCRDTARLAFDRVEDEPLLNWLDKDDQAAMRKQVDALRRRLGDVPREGNDVLVTHQPNITAVTDQVPAMGEAVVLTPTGDGTFRIEGRLVP